MLADVAEVYDSNVTFRSENRIDDLITELTGGLETVYTGRKHFLSVIGKVRQQIFAENSDFNNNAQFADVDYNYDITERDKIRFFDDFSHAEEPSSFDEDFGGVDGRFSRVRNSATLEYTREISKQFSMAGRYGNSFDLLSRSDLRDSVVNRGGIDANYFLSSASMFSLFYEFIHRHFSGSSTPTATGTDSASNAGIHEFMGGYRRYFSQQLYGDVRAGVGVVDDFGRDTLIKPVFSAALTTDADERTQLRLFAFEYRASTSSFEDSVFTSWRFSTGIRRELTKKLSGELGGFFGMGEYETQDREETLFGATLRLKYELSERWAVMGGYSTTIRDSSRKTLDYVRHLTFVRLAWKY